MKKEELSYWEVMMRKRKNPIMKKEINALIHILKERYTCYCDEYTQQLIESLEELKRRLYKNAKRYKEVLEARG